MFFNVRVTGWTQKQVTRRGIGIFCIGSIKTLSKLHWVTLFWAGTLDKVISIGHFQPQALCNSVVQEIKQPVNLVMVNS